MSKRFTDTDKWKKTFIRSLAAEYKLFWLYLLDECDHAGIWHVEFDLAEVRLGIKLSQEKTRGLFKDRIFVFDNGSKWFIPDFITFQYGELNAANRAHKSVLHQLNKYNLLRDGKVHISPLQGPKDKEQEKDKDKDKDKGAEIFSINGFWPNEGYKNLELPQGKASFAAERVRLTKKQDIDMTQVYGLWEVFKENYFTGKKYYESNEGIFNHFSNWIKDQKFSNGNSTGRQSQAGSINAVNAAFANIQRDLDETVRSGGEY